MKCKKCGKAQSWWKELAKKDKNTLIEMLWRMNSEDFREHGVIYDEETDHYTHN